MVCRGVSVWPPGPNFFAVSLRKNPFSAKERQNRRQWGENGPGTGPLEWRWVELVPSRKFSSISRSSWPHSFNFSMILWKFFASRMFSSSFCTSSASFGGNLFRAINFSTKFWKICFWTSDKDLTSIVQLDRVLITTLHDLFWWVELKLLFTIALLDSHLTSMYVVH